MENMALKIYSKFGLLLTEKVNMLVVPGLMGDIGIISGERILVYMLKAGILYLFKDNKVSERYFIYGGLFKAEDNTVSVIIEGELLLLNKINKETILERIKQAEANLAEKGFDDFSKIFYAQSLEKEQLLLTTYTDNFY